MLWRELVIEDIEDGSKARARRFVELPSLPCDSWPSHVHESGSFSSLSRLEAFRGPEALARHL